MWWFRKENWLLPSKKKVKMEFIYLGMTNYFTDCFGMLFNVGKKIVCLQCGFKSWHESRGIDCDYGQMSYYETFAYVKDTQLFFTRFVFGNSLCSFLASWLTTVSVDSSQQLNLNFWPLLLNVLWVSCKTQ